MHSGAATALLAAGDRQISDVAVDCLPAHRLASHCIDMMNRGFQPRERRSAGEAKTADPTTNAMQPEAGCTACIVHFEEQHMCF